MRITTGSSEEPIVAGGGTVVGPTPSPWPWQRRRRIGPAGLPSRLAPPGPQGLPERRASSLAAKPSKPPGCGSRRCRRRRGGHGGRSRRLEPGGDLDDAASPAFADGTGSQAGHRCWFPSIEWHDPLEMAVAGSTTERRPGCVIGMRPSRKLMAEFRFTNVREMIPSGDKVFRPCGQGRGNRTRIADLYGSVCSSRARCATD